jgi:hypothetical protein
VHVVIHRVHHGHRLHRCIAQQLIRLVTGDHTVAGTGQRPASPVGPRSRTPRRRQPLDLTIQPRNRGQHIISTRRDRLHTGRSVVHSQIHLHHHRPATTVSRGHPHPSAAGDPANRQQPADRTPQAIGLQVRNPTAGDHSDIGKLPHRWRLGCSHDEIAPLSSVTAGPILGHALEPDLGPKVHCSPTTPSC